MKKLICIIALAAFSFSTVYAEAPVKQMQQDTTKSKKKDKKWKKKTKSSTTKDTTMKM